jgi:DNA-binding MarR family transcriptional regulator
VHNLIVSFASLDKLGAVESLDHSSELELGNQLCFALYNASRTLIRAYGPLLREVGLTYPQYLVMLVLWEADGAVSVGKLGDGMHLDSGTLTPLLKRLEQRGLVQRMRDRDDERRVLVSLSPAGRDLRAQVTAIPAEVFGRCAIDADSAGDLRDTLTALARSVAAGDGPASGTPRGSQPSAPTAQPRRRTALPRADMRR